MTLLRYVLPAKTTPLKRHFQLKYWAEAGERIERREGVAGGHAEAKGW